MKRHGKIQLTHGKIKSAHGKIQSTHGKIKINSRQNTIKQLEGQRLQTITPKNLCALAERKMAANESVLNAVSLNCESCGITVSFSHNFCSFCGTALNGEGMPLKYYFRQGYEISRGKLLSLLKINTADILPC